MNSCSNYDTVSIFFWNSVQNKTDDVYVRKQQEKMSVEGSNMSS